MAGSPPVFRKAPHFLLKFPSLRKDRASSSGRMQGGTSPLAEVVRLNDGDKARKALIRYPFYR